MDACCADGYLQELKQLPSFLPFLFLGQPEVTIVCATGVGASLCCVTETPGVGAQSVCVRLDTGVREQSGREPGLLAAACLHRGQTAYPSASPSASSASSSSSSSATYILVSCLRESTCLSACFLLHLLLELPLLLLSYTLPSCLPLASASASASFQLYTLPAYLLAPMKHPSSTIDLPVKFCGPLDKMRRVWGSFVRTVARCSSADRSSVSNVPLHPRAIVIGSLKLAATLDYHIKPSRGQHPATTLGAFCRWVWPGEGMRCSRSGAEHLQHFLAELASTLANPWRTPCGIPTSVD